nr:LuxR C-terminal-related transcriptional regulator [Kordiimonas laminariae]
MRYVYAEALGIKGRPYEVLQKLHAGYTNTQIGEMLGMSTPTVSFHLKELRETLDVASTREILPTALRHGILDG